MRAFIKAMLVAIAVAAQVATVNAQSKPANFPNSVDRDHGALAAAAATEATDDSDEQILVGYVGIKHAKVSGKSIANVIYTVAFQGPYKNRTPWNVKNTKARYYNAVETLKPHYERYVDGGNFLPERLQHYSTAQHFDSRAHNDWGNYLGMEGGTCFYTAKKTKAGRPDTCRQELAEARGGKKQYAAKKPGKKKTHIASKIKQRGEKQLVASKARGGKDATVVTTIASR